MKERPILFSGPMVRAILEGRKTQTRRIVKPQPDDNGLWFMRNAPLDWREDIHGDWNPWKGETPNGDTWNGSVKCWPGDRLWVRETFGKIHYEGVDEHPTYFYRADETDAEADALIKWRPSIHMPRAASRITLEVVSVRVERLQDIREDDARAEGVGEGPQEGWVTGPVVAFADLWDSINGQDAWLANPWVWVVEFKRV